MAATVHAGGLARRMEELCRIKIQRIDEVVIARKPGFALDPRSERIPAKGGVYAFWWTGSFELLAERERRVTLLGPGRRAVRIEFDDEWLGIEAGKPVPLYVGKTADSLRSRIGKHLLLSKMQKVIPPRRAKGKSPTSSCQLRAGIERLFPKKRRPVDLLREHVGLSFVVLHGDAHAANRFYLEDLAIGTMRPPLNIDVER